METRIQQTLDEHARRLARLEARLERVETRLADAPAREGVAPETAEPADGALEARLVALERRLQMQRREAPEEAAEAKPQLPFADYFVRLAVVCFVLVGALILRVAALDGAIDAKVGTMLGLAYCVLLIASSVWQRAWRRAARHVLLLQLSGTLLAPLVVLETYHKSAILSLPVALALVLVVSLAAGIHGAARGERLLADAALTAGVVTLFALGFSPDALAWRTSATVVLVAAALVVADRRPWPELRPLVLLPVLVAGGTGAMLLADKPSLPPGTGLVLVLAGAGTWVVVAASHALRRHRLDAKEAAWLPVVTLWAYGLAVHQLSTLGAAFGAGVAVLALAVSALAAARRSRARVALLGAAATGAILAVASVPVLDPTGIGSGAAALLVFGIAVAARSPWLAAASELLVVVASVPVLRRFGAMGTDALGLAAAAAGIVATALFVHYAVARRSAGALVANDDAELAPIVARALAPFSLAFAILGLFGALEIVAFALLGAGPALDLTQTLIIAVLAVGALRSGTSRGLRDLRIAGLVGVAVLAGKVLMHDLPELDGAPKVASVVALGVVSLIVSLTLSRGGAKAAARAQRERDEAASAAGPHKAA